MALPFTIICFGSSSEPYQNNKWYSKPNLNLWLMASPQHVLSKWLWIFIFYAFPTLRCLEQIWFWIFIFYSFPTKKSFLLGLYMKSFSYRDFLEKIFSTHFHSFYELFPLPSNYPNCPTSQQPVAIISNLKIVQPHAPNCLTPRQPVPIIWYLKIVQPNAPEVSSCCRSPWRPFHNKETKRVY